MVFCVPCEERKAVQIPMSIKSNRLIHYILVSIFVFLGVILDQITKYLAVLYLKDQPPYVVWNGVFELSYLENRGAAFGMLQNWHLFFIICTVLILAAVIWFFLRVPMTARFLPLRFCAVLITAGAVGNLIDRMRLNYVVDFFSFVFIDFPIFNVADIYVTVSVFLLVLLILFYYKEEELAQIFHRRNGS